MPTWQLEKFLKRTHTRSTSVSNKELTFKIHLPLPLFFYQKLKNHPSLVDCSTKALADVNFSLGAALQSFIDDPSRLEMEDEESKVREEKTDAAQYDREAEQSNVQEEEKTDPAFYWTVVVKREGVLKEVPVCEGGEKNPEKSGSLSRYSDFSSMTSKARNLKPPITGFMKLSTRTSLDQW